MCDMSQDIAEFAKALAAAQAEMGHAGKDAKNDHFRNKYATLASVLDAARPILSKHGLAVMQPASNDEHGNVVVETILLHSSGQWMRSAMACRPLKNDAQGMGSVVTYLRRYALAAMVGIAQADDDGEAAAGRGATATDANPPMSPPKRQPMTTQKPADAKPQDFTVPVPIDAEGSGSDWKRWAKYEFPDRIRACRNASEIDAVFAANADSLENLKGASQAAHAAIMELRDTAKGKAA